jgi:hypothetical protein
VRLLTRGARPAGAYEARWDGRNDAGGSVAAGVYVAELRVSTRILREKVVLTR